MFTIESRINGMLIGVIYGQNMGFADEPNEDMCQYNYTYTDIKDGVSILGSVNHHRDQGLAKLVVAIYRDMEDK
jgi:hypothetical protein